MKENKKNKENAAGNQERQTLLDNDDKYDENDEKEQDEEAAAKATLIELQYMISVIDASKQLLLRSKSTLEKAIISNKNTKNPKDDGGKDSKGAKETTMALPTTAHDDAAKATKFASAVANMDIKQAIAFRRKQKEDENEDTGNVLEGIGEGQFSISDEESSNDDNKDCEISQKDIKSTKNVTKASEYDDSSLEISFELMTELQSVLQHRRGGNHTICPEDEEEDENDNYLA
eukprot:jgi/Bigna1/83073/fgenesh1_pg.101_\